MKYEKNISAIKTIEVSDTQSILVSVEIIDKLDDSIKIGSYQVDSDGVLYGELDEYLKLYHKDFIPTAKEIMIDSGLTEIVGNYKTISDIFKDDFDDTSINLTFDKNPERWQRTLEYLKDSNISIQEIHINEHVRL